MDGIHHLALRVKDCAASARFYAAACGLHEIRRVDEAGETRAIWLRAGPTVLMLERGLRGEGALEGSGHVLVFPARDLHEAERRLASLGTKITDRTASTLYFQDPDGHRAGLSVHRFHETEP